MVNSLRKRLAAQGGFFYLIISNKGFLQFKKYIFITLKQISCILFISMLVWSQYARQFSYVECIIANNFRSDAVKCDCEKINPDTTASNTSLPHSKNHAHNSVDEWYTAHKSLLLSAAIMAAPSNDNNLYFASACAGSQGSVDRPPQFS